MTWQHHNNQANTLKAAGRLTEADRHYRRAIRLAPRAIEPVYNRALAFIDSGNFPAAEAALKAALKLNPDHGLTHLNLANILNLQSRLPEAETHYLRAKKLLPANEVLLNNLGQIYAKQRRYAEAERSYREALTIAPNYALACTNLAELLATHGFLEDSIALQRAALAAEPTNSQLHSNLLFTLTHSPTITANELLAEHHAFARRFDAHEHAPHANSRDPRRRLRIGFVSADLRDHPVVRYLRPALQYLSNHEDLELIAYNNSAHSDAETAAYKPLFSAWYNVLHLSDEALAQHIRADAIDILFDLSGHSGHNRLATFTRKPAPIQVSWLGYPFTTGLRSIDYVIADEHLVPREHAQHFTERILYLPAASTFAPVAEAPAVNTLPASPFTFACLARANKLHRALIATWSAILRGAPASRLMLATMPDGNIPPRLLDWFAAEGIMRDRLLFAHPRSVHDVLTLHHNIHLALDTFPYNGSTSNNHAAAMGVPTLTLAGNIAPSRMGASLAAHLGLREFITTSEAEYIAAAIAWTKQLDELAVIRSTLRERFAASELQQHEAFAAALALKLREAWQHWCAGADALVH